MKTKKAIPKLLAPVRDETSLSAAISAGADAVFFGIGELNMRVSSKGISLEDLPETVARCHDANVAVYITLNIVVYDAEMEKVEETIKACKAAGVDAIICWDFAVINLCKKHGIDFHISTQASVSNTVSAKTFEDMGAKCAVLARECTLEQIKNIKANTNMKIEIFSHGAMCVSVSGRCFLSQFLECKSANRGACFQPCRRKYRIIDIENPENELEIGEDYVLSPKDLCTLQILDEVVDTGADLLKIEGRSRSPEYISETVKAYRTALDAIAEGEYTDELKTKLIADAEKVYNRGFSTGFMFGRPAKDGWAKQKDNLATEKKWHIGKITNFYKKNNIAEAIIQSKNHEYGGIKAGDEVYVQGPTTGSVRIKIADVKEHDTGEVTFPSDTVLRTSDEIFKIIKIKPQT